MASRPELPALHTSASIASDKSQRLFLWLIRLEFLCLFVAGVMALEFNESKDYYLTYAAILIVGLVVMVTRSALQPEQQWYRARAVAESIKTSAWRYMMQAHPYQTQGNQDAASREFLTYIRKILSTNKVLSQEGVNTNVSGDQVTIFMQGIRQSSLEKRRDCYVGQRIKDQEAWYRRKASSNRRMFKFWVFASGCSYVAAASLALARIAHPDWKHLPIDPLIILASSLLAWVQIKRHSELSSSYSLTATEIAMAREALPSPLTEGNFSDFVNDTELAFSREHTQWIARQHTAG